MPRRLLTAAECAEARLVFGDALDYTRAFVWEDIPWPNWIADVGGAMHGYKRTWHNAVTLGQMSCFPVRIRTGAETLAGSELGDIAWLMHELTHQWQFQHLGWRYLWEAVRVQVTEGLNSYQYQGAHESKEAALMAARASGRRLLHFNMEQQGDIARDFYLALKAGRDTRPWEPFIHEFTRSGQ